MRGTEKCVGRSRERGENNSVGNTMKEKNGGDAHAGKFVTACKTRNLVKVELRGNKK